MSIPFDLIVWLTGVAVFGLASAFWYGKYGDDDPRSVLVIAMLVAVWPLDIAIGIVAVPLYLVYRLGKKLRKP